DHRGDRPVDTLRSRLTPDPKLSAGLLRRTSRWERARFEFCARTCPSVVGMFDRLFPGKRLSLGAHDTSRNRLEFPPSQHFALSGDAQKVVRMWLKFATADFRGRGSPVPLILSFLENDDGLPPLDDLAESSGEEEEEEEVEEEEEEEEEAGGGDSDADL
ncbi:hypothetical protein TeGR_g3777, partial [Tetraparma gracilis]